MNQSLLITAPRPASHPLEIDKSTLLVLIAAALLLTETFSGALRYYSALAGVSWLLYLPKIACLAALGLELLSHRGQPLFWLVLLALATSAWLALLNGAALANIGFTLFMYLPLLFGVVCGRHLERRLALLIKVIGFGLLASFVGIALDMLISVPWKGYSYMLGNVELSGNRSWAMDDIDRIGGFARMSTSLSMMIAVYSLFLAAFIRSRLLRVLLYGVSLAGIVLTTNKSSVVAYMVTLLMLTFAAYRFASATAFLLAVLGGVALPITSLLLRIDPIAAVSSSLLSSFADRLVNSWPNFIDNVASQASVWWGAGFGAVGSGGTAFPIAGLELLAIADNTALYLWGMLGVGGVALYLLTLPLLLRLHERGPRVRGGLLGAVFCICLVAWATDVLEVSVASLFLGLAIAHVLAPLNLPATSLMAPRITDPRHLA